MFSDAQKAEICYTAQRAMQAMLGEEMPSWEDLPCDQRQIGIDSVRMIQLGHSPEQLHEMWREFWRDKGYVYGEKRDDAADPPTHPVLAPWGSLTPQYQVRERLYQLMVVAMTLDLPWPA